MRGVPEIMNDISDRLETASDYRVGRDLADRLVHAAEWQEKQAVVMAEAAGVIRALREELGRSAVDMAALKADLWMWRNGVHPEQKGSDHAVPGEG
jgi:hypothetical protein